MDSAAGQPVTYSLKFQSRALTAVQSNKFISTWIVGTNSLREENEVRIMQYDADNERLVCAKALTHAPEIWDIAACPSSDELIITVWSQGGNYSATLWSTNSTSAVERITDLPGHTGLIRRALWHSTKAELAVTIEEGALHTWSVSNQGASCTASQQAGELLQLWSGQLSPHDTHTCATAGGNNIQMWDLRSMQLTSEIQAAHRMPTRDVCFSPASEHRLVSCGDDCKLRIWDTRLLGKGESLLELGGHSHWVWWAQYCPFHEQLIASASSDTLVNLYHAPHVASMDPAGDAAPAGTESAADVGALTGAPGSKKSVPGTPTRGSDLDGKVRTYDEHEDSVYGLAWSSADPWLFASLSYDGRMVVNKVPKNTKYKVIV